MRAFAACLLAACLLAACLVGSPGCGSSPRPVPAADPRPDGTVVPSEAAPSTLVAARVNNVPIPGAAYLDAYDIPATRSRSVAIERLERIGETILRRLVDEELIRQAAVVNGIEVPEEEVDAAFAEHQKHFRSAAQVESYVAQGHPSDAEIRRKLLRKLQVDYLLAQRGALDITHAELLAVYEKNRHAFTDQAGIRARHLFLKVSAEATAAESEATRKRLQAIRGAILGGLPFADAAKKYSQSPDASRGGDLGFFAKGQMVKPFEEAAFRLRFGRVSKPVRTHFGWHLILVLERRKRREKPLEEVADVIRQDLRKKRMVEARRKLMDDLRTTAEIEMLREGLPPWR